MLNGVHAPRPTSTPAAATRRWLDPQAAGPKEVTDHLTPGVRAIVDLYLAHRLEGEHHAECFARLGAPTYAAMLHEALSGLGLANPLGPAAPTATAPAPRQALSLPRVQT